MAPLAAAAIATYRRRPEDDLVGEVALVTGASRGLELLIATELARCRSAPIIAIRSASVSSRYSGLKRTPAPDSRSHGPFEIKIFLSNGPWFHRLRDFAADKFAHSLSSSSSGLIR